MPATGRARPASCAASMRPRPSALPSGTSRRHRRAQRQAEEATCLLPAIALRRGPRANAPRAKQPFRFRFPSKWNPCPLPADEPFFQEPGAGSNGPFLGGYRAPRSGKTERNRVRRVWSAEQGVPMMKKSLLATAMFAALAGSAMAQDETTTTTVQTPDSTRETTVTKSPTADGGYMEYRKTVTSSHHFSIGPWSLPSDYVEHKFALWRSSACRPDGRCLLHRQLRLIRACSTSGMPERCGCVSVRMCSSCVAMTARSSRPITACSTNGARKWLRSTPV